MTNSTHLRSLSCRTTLTEIERRPRVALCVGPRWRPSPMFTPLRSRLPRPTPGCGGGRPATVSPRRISGMCGPLFRRSLELAPCPTQKRCGGWCLTSLRFGAPRTASLSSAASASAVARSAPLRRSSVLASPCRAAHCAALRAPRPLLLCVGIRSGAVLSLRAPRSAPRRSSRAAPCSSRPRPLRGPGFLPGPLPTSAAPPPQIFNN